MTEKIETVSFGDKIHITPEFLEETSPRRKISTVTTSKISTWVPDQFSKSSFDKIPAYAKPPWPEWNDDDVNKETWEDTSESTNAYEDPTNLILPSSIRPVQWVRPSYLYQKPEIIDWTENTLNLIVPNTHLCEMSEIMRFIISEISELYDYSMEHEVKTEGEDVVFVRNANGNWKPWDHIYSMCKAGVKGDEPRYNHAGRYFVRLYYLGCWRRITVDDTIPILKNGLKGLPVGPKEELWPLLLTKALLKISSLTWDDLNGDEIKGFSPLACLTGWIHEWSPVEEPIAPDALWDDLLEILPKYKPPFYQEPEKKNEDDDWTVLTPATEGAGDGLDESEEVQEVLPEPEVKEPEVEEKPVKKKKGKKDKKKKGKKNQVDEQEGSEATTINKTKSKIAEKALDNTSGEKVTGETQLDESKTSSDAANEVKGKKKGKKKKDEPSKEEAEPSKGNKKGKKKKEKVEELKEDESSKDKKGKKKKEKVEEMKEEDESSKDKKGKKKKEKSEPAIQEENESKEKVKEKKGKKDEAEGEAVEPKDKKKKAKKGEAKAEVADKEGKAEKENEKPKKEKEGKKTKAKNKKTSKTEDATIEVDEEPQLKENEETSESKSEAKPTKKKKKNAEEKAEDEKEAAEVPEKKAKKDGKKGKAKKEEVPNSDEKGGKKAKGKKKKAELDESKPEEEEGSKKKRKKKKAESDEKLEEDSKGKKKEKGARNRRKSQVEGSNELMKEKKEKSQELAQDSAHLHGETDQEYLERQLELMKRFDGGSRSEQFTGDFKLALKEKLMKRAEKLEQQQKLLQGLKRPIANWRKEKVPPLNEILAAVQKFSSIAQHPVPTSVEMNARKEPEILTVVLEEFPTENKSIRESIPAIIPAFLHHPVHLSQVRDCILTKDTNRPRTPLWKRYRWKAWAMKKGLIPMDEEHFKDKIRSIKINSPFPFKKNWLKLGEGGLYEEEGEREPNIINDKEFDEQYPTFSSAISIGIDNQQHPSTNLRQSLESPPPPPQALSRQLSAKLVYEPEQHLVTPALSFKASLAAKLRSSNQTFPPSKENPPTSPESTFEDGIESRKSSAGGSKRNNNHIEGGNSQPQIEKNIYPNELYGETKGGRLSAKATEDLPKSPIRITPNSACVGLWIDVEELAPKIRKFCKFYPPKTNCGSYFNLIRTSKIFNDETVTVTRPSLPIMDDSNENENEKTNNVHLEKIVELTDAHNLPNHNQDLSTSISFEKLKTLNILASHLNDTDGFDNGFYIFTDSWTEQELMFSLEVLQHSIIKQFVDSALEIDTVPVQFDLSNSNDLSQLKKLQNPKVSIGIYLEPWDWRNDRSIEQPVLCASTQHSLITHFSLPPGRSTFRLWVIANYPQISTSGITSYRKLEEIRKIIDNFKKNQITQFTLRILSKSPIHVGSREEVQDYMTNQPVLFLKQCEIFSHCIWSLLLSFGKSPVVYAHVLKDLRNSYCPSFSEPNKINIILKKVHESFEEKFVALIRDMNHGFLDGWIMLAIRSLLLSPTAGKGYSRSPKGLKIHLAHHVDSEQILHKYHKAGRNPDEIVKKIVIIQRYFRGWQVRRLFQVRQKKHKNFLHVEQQVRKIALLIAQHSDSSYTHPTMTKTKTGEGDTAEQQGSEDLTPEPSLIPRPANWAVEFLRNLIELHPMLVTIHPHAYCVPSHIRIKTMEGILPYFSKEIEWLPFCRFHLMLPEQKEKWVYCELDLQVHPRDGIVLKIVNNDTHQQFQTVSTTMYLGRLPVNRLGFTVLLYRWANSSDEPDAFRKTPSQKWKLRVISPQIQKSIVLADGLYKDEFANPRNLVLHRFTDYFIPNRDNCICRYTFETSLPVIYLSFRFKPSCPKAIIVFEIRDAHQDLIIFEHKAVGAFILPSVRIEGKTYSPFQEESQKSFYQIRHAESLLETPKISVLEIDSSLSRYSSDPALYLKTDPIHKYTINIYAQENSWLFNEAEWNFSQNEKNKFWKQFMVKRRVPRTPRHIREMYETFEEEEAREAAFHEQFGGEPVTTVEPEPPVASPNEPPKAEKDIKDGTGNRKTKPKKNKSKLKKGKRGSEFGADDVTAISAQNVNKKLSIPEPPAAEQVSPVEKAVSEEPKPQPVIPVKPKQKLRKPILVQGAVKPYEFEEDPPSEEEETFKLDGYESSNVKVEIGGSHSVKVTDSDQPSWILEILAPGDETINIQSNRAMLQSKLRQKKVEWKTEQNERLRNGFSTMHHLLATNDPGTYLLSDPFVLVKLLTNLDAHPYLKEEEFNRFTYGEGVHIPIHVPKSTGEETEAAEKPPDPHQIVPKIKGIGKKGPFCPPPTPTSKLQIATSAQKHAMQVFPNSLAGSDFSMDVTQHHQLDSIIPVDLSIGSPSFLELAKQHIPKYLTASSSSDSLTTTSKTAIQNALEYEGESDTAWKQFYDHKRQYEECRGEHGELYGESQTELLAKEDSNSDDSIDNEYASDEMLFGDLETRNEQKRKSSSKPRRSYAERKCTIQFGVTRTDEGPKLRNRIQEDQHHHQSIKLANGIGDDEQNAK